MARTNELTLLIVLVAKLNALQQTCTPTLYASPVRSHQIQNCADPDLSKDRKNYIAQV